MEASQSDCEGASQPINTSNNFRTVLRIQKHNYLKMKQLNKLRQRDTLRSLILKQIFISPPKVERSRPLRPLNGEREQWSPQNLKMRMTNSSFKAMNQKVKQNYKFVKMVGQGK